MENTMSECCTSSESVLKNPVTISFTISDYIKLFYCWIRSFRNNISVTPGIYYTGDQYDVTAPMLVTSNYLLTFYLVWRVVRRLNVRLLVIDTRGINVWCASGKGRFSAETILEHLEQYTPEQKTRSGKLELILPKLSLSGVNLKVLRRNMIKPVIGPIYRQDIPAFLGSDTLKDCREDTYRFNLRDRLFIMVPSLFQFSRYLLPVVAGLAVWHWFFKTGIHYQFYLLSLTITLLYIILFPLLPTRWFSVKALSEGIVISAVVNAWMLYRGVFSWLMAGAITTAIFGINLFFGLYFTGNSGVSNYTLVKREIVIFLPVTALVLVASAVLFILEGVTS
jgi:hypothetical protein